MNLIIIGLGSVGRRFLVIVSEKHRDLKTRYGLDLRVVGVADSQGSAIDSGGLRIGELVEIKERGGSASDVAGAGIPGMSGLELIQELDADVVCEAGPVNLHSHGEPGLSHIRAALARGRHVVTTNKGPILLAYRELRALAHRCSVKLRFDGTVAGGLPVLYHGMRDLRGAVIARIESVPNLATGFIVDRLACGETWEEAIANAQKEGSLEGDGAWDLDGWDVAAKLAILAEAVLDVDVNLDEVQRTGIRNIDLEWVKTEWLQGRRVRLLGKATRRPDGSYCLRADVAALAADHPLARLGPKGMGAVFETDIFGTTTLIVDEPIHSPFPSAATILRDILDIYC